MMRRWVVSVLMASTAACVGGGEIDGFEGPAGPTGDTPPANSDPPGTPADPNDPANPVDPVIPDPVNPTDPVDPADPVDPTDPPTNPVTGSATLQWLAPTTNVDGTPLTDLAGYVIRRGTSSGAYASTTDIGVPTCTSVTDGTQCSYVVDGLASGTHYFAVAAYDISGYESALSNEASKAIP